MLKNRSISQYKYLGWILILSILISCEDQNWPTSAKSENGKYQALIEMPSGTTEFYEFDAIAREMFSGFEGRNKIPYLPVPWNYGVIPGTKVPKSEGGNGGNLDVMVLSGHVDRGSVFEIKPVAFLKIQRNSIWENKIIAVPEHSDDNNLGINNYYELQRDHYLCKNILVDWFVEAYHPDTTVFIGWDDEQAAISEIERRMKN